MKLVTKMRLSLLGLPGIWSFMILAGINDWSFDWVAPVCVICGLCLFLPCLTARCPSCQKAIYPLFDRKVWWSLIWSDIPTKWPLVPTVCPHCRVPLDDEARGKGATDTLNSVKQTNNQSP